VNVRQNSSTLADTCNLKPLTRLIQVFSLPSFYILNLNTRPLDLNTRKFVTSFINVSVISHWLLTCPGP